MYHFPAKLSQNKAKGHLFKKTLNKKELFLSQVFFYILYNIQSVHE